jgi:predicted dienelactone hydrolase
MRITRYLVLLLVLILISAACMPIQPESAASAAMTGDTSEATNTASAADAAAAAYAQPGPHAAGYQALVIDDGHGDALDVSLWYPALNTDGADIAITYDVIVKAPEMQGDGAAVVYGHALADAPADDSGGPYPLVVFSHGFGLNAPAYHTLAEHYASYGFVVLAPEHVESDWFDGVAHTVERPRDIVRTLDYAETLNADGALASLIDLDNVAVVGHSYGGYTALAAAGAQIDLNAL